MNIGNRILTAAGRILLHGNGNRKAGSLEDCCCGLDPDQRRCHYSDSRSCTTFSTSKSCITEAEVPGSYSWCYNDRLNKAQERTSTTLCTTTTDCTQSATDPGASPCCGATTDFFLISGNPCCAKDCEISISVTFTGYTGTPPTPDWYTDCFAGQTFTGTATESDCSPGERTFEIAGEPCASWPFGGNPSVFVRYELVGCYSSTGSATLTGVAAGFAIYDDFTGTGSLTVTNGHDNPVAVDLRSQKCPDVTIVNPSQWMCCVSGLP